MEKCVKEGELMVITKDIANLTEQMGKYEDRLEKKHAGVLQEINCLRKVYDSIHSLSTSVAIIATESKITKESVIDLSADIKELKHLPKETENIKETVRVIQNDVDNFKKAPAEDMRYYKRALIAGIIAAVVAAFFAGTLY